MTNEPFGEAPLGTTYNGFSGPAQPTQPAPGPGPFIDSRMKRLLAGGVAGALVLGLGFGLLAKPDLKADPARPAARTARADTDDQVQVLLNRAPPPPVLPVTTIGKRLEVLTPAQAAAAPRAVVAAPPVRRLEVARAEPVRIDPGPAEVDDEAILDCRRPADRAEARLCRDLAAEEDPGPRRRWRERPVEEDVYDEGPPQADERPFDG